MFHQYQKTMLFYLSSFLNTISPVSAFMLSRSPVTQRGCPYHGCVCRRPENLFQWQCPHQLILLPNPESKWSDRLMPCPNCQKIIDNQNLIAFSKELLGHNNIIYSAMGKRFNFVVYTSPAIFFVFVFLANTTGTSKYSATIQAIPIPDASIVRILLISSPSNGV